ncbi:MAG TPA: response regulator transcription factor [Thermomicrobiales bacterium]|nr:response regulator transcription factor [Thermomicrobiales bacterium]
MADRVVIIDGDSLTAKLMRFALEDASFEVAIASRGIDAFDLVLTRETSLLILDVNLPDTDGFALLSELHARRYSGPSVFVTARGSIADKLRGFALGADDYIVKPFEPLELVARVESVIRRFRRADLMAMGTIVRVGDSELSIGELSYRSDAVETTSLTPTEMRILEVLMRNPAIAISRERLIERIWGYDFVGETNRVDVYIRRIRRKIEPDPDRPRYLHTVRGIGYVFRADGDIRLDLSFAPRGLKVVQPIPA